MSSKKISEVVVKQRLTGSEKIPISDGSGVAKATEVSSIGCLDVSGLFAGKRMKTTIEVLLRSRLYASVNLSDFVSWRSKTMIVPCDMIVFYSPDNNYEYGLQVTLVDADQSCESKFILCVVKDGEYVKGTYRYVATVNDEESDGDNVEHATKGEITSWTDEDSSDSGSSSGGSSSGGSTTPTTEYVTISVTAPTGLDIVVGSTTVSAGNSRSLQIVKGSSVNVVGTVKTGYTFGSWSGLVSGSATSTTFTANSSGSISASVSAVAVSDLVVGSNNIDNTNTSRELYTYADSKTRAGRLYSFIPTTSGKYKFSFVDTGDTLDTYGYLFPEAKGTPLISNDDSNTGSTQDPMFEYELVVGTKYYVMISLYSENTSNSVTGTLTIAKVESSSGGSSSSGSGSSSTNEEITVGSGAYFYVNCPTGFSSVTVKYNGSVVGTITTSSYIKVNCNLNEGSIVLVANYSSGTFRQWTEYNASGVSLGSLTSNDTTSPVINSGRIGYKFSPELA